MKEKNKAQEEIRKHVSEKAGMRILHLDNAALFQSAIFPPQYFIKKQKYGKNTVGKIPQYIICSNSKVYE